MTYISRQMHETVDCIIVEIQYNFTWLEKLSSLHHNFKNTILISLRFCFFKKCNMATYELDMLEVGHLTYILRN
jgi:hypothetical protein